MSRVAKTPQYQAFNERLFCYGEHQSHTGRLDGWLTGDKLMLEVGAGAAAVSMSFAQAHTKWQVIALDLKADRLGKAARRVDELKMKNIAFLQSDLRKLDEHVDLQGKVDLIWITFPDPYPKDRQEKHRLTNPAMQAIYQKLLKPKGVLRFKTDNSSLFEYTLTAIKEAEIFEVSYQTHDLHASTVTDPVALTKTLYEHRFLNEGLTTNYLEARLNIV